MKTHSKGRSEPLYVCKFCQRDLKPITITGFEGIVYECKNCDRKVAIST